MATVKHEFELVICQQVATMEAEPAEGSEVRWCDVCGAEIWVGAATLGMNADKLICEQCAPGVIDTLAHPVLDLAPGHVQEMRDHGMSNGEIAAAIEWANRVYGPKGGRRKGARPG